MNNKIAISRRRLLQGAALATTAATAGLAGFPAIAQGAKRELRIGHQKGYLSLLKGRGTLEQRLAPLGVAVKWTEFTAGPVQLEALNIGSIDFGDVGEAPPIFAQAAGAPLAYVGATVPRPASARPRFSRTAPPATPSSGWRRSCAPSRQLSTSAPATAPSAGRSRQATRARRSAC